MWGRNRALDVFAVATKMLDGHLAVAQGNQAAAIESFRVAAVAEDALHFDEPEAWYLPAREPLGKLLLERNEPADAEKVFGDELRRHPRSGRALHGLALALQQQGKPAAAIEREFTIAWKNAEAPPWLGIGPVPGRAPSR